MSWQLIEEDDRYRIKFRIFKCDQCHKWAVTTWGNPTGCTCRKR